jgi:hypothetical protein
MAYPPERAIGHQPGGGMPPWALAVAEDAPTGVDRQGRGRSSTTGLPRDEARPPHGDWAATPQAAPQSLRKTS